jgi:predicted transcriptional regulator
LSEYLKSLNAYTARIKSDLKVERLLPALATQRVKEGETVGIIMKEGVLYAVAPDHQTPKHTESQPKTPTLRRMLAYAICRAKVKKRQEVVMVRC